MPNLVNGGQDVGQSLTAAKVEFDSTAANGGQPADVTITIGATGQSAVFNSTVTAMTTSDYTVSGQPDYSGPSATPGTVLYQWQQSTDGGTIWTDIAGATAASYTQANVTAAMNGYQYRGLVSCAENSCQVESNPAELIVIQLQPSYNMAKTVNPTSINAPGSLTYTFTFTNNGNVDLQNLTVTDADIDVGSLSCNGDGDNDGDIDSLAIGVSETCTATRTITQADINAGIDLVNTATPSATDTNGAVVDEDNDGNPSTPNDPSDNTATATVTQVPVSGLALVKTAAVNDVNGNGFTDVSDTITYSFTVSNTGNVILTFTGVNDSLLSGLSCSLTPATLAVGATDVPLVCTGNVYTITAADVTAGLVTNSATVTANDPNSNPVTDTSGTANDNDTPTVVSIPAVPRLALVKTAAVNDVNGNGFTDAGDTITYGFTVSNTGNMALNFTGVTDPMLSGLSCTLTPPALAVGATGLPLVCTNNVYTITAADIAAGQVTNSATGTANDPNGNLVSDLSGTANNNNAPTVMPINLPAPVNSAKVPGLSVWGMLLVMLSVVGAVLYTRQRKLT